MRSCFLVMVVLVVGCAADVEEPPRAKPATHVENVTALAVADDAGSDGDICALAAELPLDDICSLICDPAAMATRMIDDGDERGQCYQLYCTLADEVHVLVGVCLPP